MVVPVKRLAEAKTRLRGAVTAVPHDRLVLALAQDTVRAVLACPLVSEALVVTDVPPAATVLGELGARVVSDQPDAGLNPALAYAAGLVGRGRPVAALTADLPALRPSELAAALGAAAALGRRGFVPDAAGTGTTLLAAPLFAAPPVASPPVAGPPVASPPGSAGPSHAVLAPQFGPGSAARHAASGAQRLDGDWPSLRRDVDTAADLAEAARLGLGPHTATLWHATAGLDPDSAP